MNLSLATQGESRPIRSNFGQSRGKTQSIDNLYNFHNRIIQILDNLCYSGFAMFSGPYQQALAGLLDAAKLERDQLLAERGRLELQLEENAEAVREIERQIKQFEDWILTGIVVDTTADTQPLAKEKSFTRAVAFVLKNAHRPLSPTEIRDRLQELGFDTSGWKTDIVSSVHTVLKRLLVTAPPKVEESGEPRRKVYRWIGSRTLTGEDSGVGNGNA